MILNFWLIGENVHASRAFIRESKRRADRDDGNEVIAYLDKDGKQRELVLDEKWRGEPVKHMMQAMESRDADYICAAARRQVELGADYLDINVDEISYKLDIQTAAMKWVVQSLQSSESVPLSIDSSSADIINAGLEAYDISNGPPMINSISLEEPRLPLLEIAVNHNSPLVATAFGAETAPHSTEERVSNVTELMQHIDDAKIERSRVFVDCICFPLGADKKHGMDFLDAVEQIRERFGPEIHITGGMTNLSFGLPNRKLINQVFMNMAIERGLDCLFIDPLQVDVQEAQKADRDGELYKLAENAILGNDDFCMEYIMHFKED